MIICPSDAIHLLLSWNSEPVHRIASSYSVLTCHILDIAKSKSSVPTSKPAKGQAACFSTLMHGYCWISDKQ